MQHWPVLLYSRSSQLLREIALHLDVATTYERDDVACPSVTAPHACIATAGTALCNSVHSTVQVQVTGVQHVSEKFPHQSMRLRHYISSHIDAMVLDGLYTQDSLNIYMYTHLSNWKADNDCCWERDLNGMRAFKAPGLSLSANCIMPCTFLWFRTCRLCDVLLLCVDSSPFPSSLHAQVCADGDSPLVELHNGVQRHLPVLPGQACPQLPAAASGQAIRQVFPVAGMEKSK